jgi:hypothetical protein
MIFAMFMVWINPPIPQPSNLAPLVPQSVFIEQFSSEQACEDALPQFNASKVPAGWQYQCFEQQTSQWQPAN